MDISKLAQMITGARQEMIALSAKHGLNSPLVLEASERLDALLNEYQKLSYQEMRRKSPCTINCTAPPLTTR